MGGEGFVGLVGVRVERGEYLSGVRGISCVAARSL